MPGNFNVSNQSGNIDNIGGDQNVYYDDDAAQLEALRRAGFGTKFLVVLAVFLCIGGIAVVAISAFSTNHDLTSPDFGKIPAGVPIGAGLFFAGFVLMAISSFSLALRRRR
jgi:uncharacterized membrane protein (DUF485 family)